MKQISTFVLAGLLAVMFSGQGMAQSWKDARSSGELTVPGRLSFTVAGLYSVPSGTLYDDGFRMKSGGGVEVTASYLIRPKLALRLTGQRSGAQMDDGLVPGSGMPLPNDIQYQLVQLSGHLYRVMAGIGYVEARSTVLFPRVIASFSYDVGVTVNDIEYTYYLTDTKTNETTLNSGIRNDKAFFSHRVIGSLAPMISSNVAAHISGTLGMDIQSGGTESQGSESGWMFDLGLGVTFWP